MAGILHYGGRGALDDAFYPIRLGPDRLQDESVGVGVLSHLQSGDFGTGRFLRGEFYLEVKFAIFTGNFSPMAGWRHRIGSTTSMGEKDQHGAARSVSAVTERDRSHQTDGNGRIVDRLCATASLRSHAVRALRQHETGGREGVKTLQERRRMYGVTTRTR